MRGGGRDSPYIPHEGQTGQSPAYPNPSMSASLNCWPSVPVVFSVPASHAEMYYVPQPMGLPTAAIPPYAWPLYACQQPIYPAMEPWQGGPASPYHPVESQRSSVAFTSAADRRSKDAPAEYSAQAPLPRGRRQHRSRPPSSSTIGQDRSSASSLKESLLPGSPPGSSTSSFQSYRNRQRHPSADQQQAYAAPSQSPIATDTEGEQESKSSAQTTAMLPNQSTAATPPEATSAPTEQGSKTTQEATLIAENPLASHFSSTRKTATAAAAGGQKPAASAARPQTPQTPIKSQAQGIAMEGQSKITAPLKPCMYFLRTGTCDYGEDCKFAHPEDQKPVFTSAGLPIRPGKPLCPFHEQYKWCGFAKGCKFSHREDQEVASSRRDDTPEEARDTPAAVSEAASEKSEE